LDSDQFSTSEILFLQLVSMFQMAAMQQMGKIIDPISGEVKRDLDQAKMSIDILDVLKEKTKGNLNSSEREFLDKVLFELHMNFVDEKKASSKSDEKAASGDEPRNAPAGEASDDKAKAAEEDPAGE